MVIFHIPLNEQIGKCYDKLIFGNAQTIPVKSAINVSLLAKFADGDAFNDKQKIWPPLFSKGPPFEKVRWGLGPLLREKTCRSMIKIHVLFYQNNVAS